MSLSGYQNINSTVRYGADGFDFAGTLGDFIGNAEFSYGNEDYKSDVSAFKQGGYAAPNARSNVWYVLSAIGQDIGEITYANVKNYIDIVSNIDMCKTKSLMSMMKNVDMDYSIIEDIGDFPLEVLNLIDIFSIDKKYLLDNDKIKDDLVKDITSHTVTKLDGANADYYRLFRNEFTVSSAAPTGKRRLVLDIDNGYSGKDIADLYGSAQDLIAAGRSVYDANLNLVICRKYGTFSSHGGPSCEMLKFNVPQFVNGRYEPLNDGYMLLSAGSAVCSAEAEQFENDVSPDGTAAYPFGPDLSDIMVQYAPAQGENLDKPFELGIDSIDDDRYSEYVKSVFTELLSSYLDMRYNVTADEINAGEIHPIRYYIKNEYQQNSSYYKNRAQLTSDSMQFKRVNNIPLSFDEQRVLDDIDAGLDDLDNYEGYVRQLLDMEIDRRARRLTYSDMPLGRKDGENDDYSASNLSADNFNDISKNKTRYSYYRKAKVLEYARFVDNVFALGEMGSKSSVNAFKSYRFNPDCYVVENPGAANIFLYNGSSCEINEAELNAAAENLTIFTQYIAKLRNKIKLQVRKNYMKGTNNLLIYLINQFLVDYSRTNRLFRDYSRNDLIKDIYKNLSSSDSDDIEIVEYRDDTEYYNLESKPSLESIVQTYNNDFKAAYFKPIAGGAISVFDGKLFTLDQIKEFYLSSLGLKNYISDDTDGFVQFISCVFEIGRSDSFIDQRGVFASKLDSGKYTVELWSDLDKISSNYVGYKGYLSAGDHTYPSDTVQNQLTDMVENYVGQRLSDQYLSAVSDVYDQYHVEIEQISSDLTDLSSQYTKLVGSGDYAPYLNKSQCKYCYTNGEDDLVQYRHDWYNDNPDVYGSQYLIDKIGDLKNFTTVEKNMKCYPVLDTLEYVKNEFDRISAQLMSDAEQPAEEYGYIDIESPFLDKEMQSIYKYLDDEIELRKTQLQNILANIRQQAQQAKDTYDKLDNAFAAAMANYDTENGTPMGVINTNLFGLCNNKNKNECSLEKWFKGSGTYEKFCAAKKWKTLIESGDIEVLRGVLIGNTSTEQKKGAKYNIAFYRYTDEDKNAKAKYDKFDATELGESGDGDCTITEDMPLNAKIEKVQAWMSQITDGHIEAGEEDSDCVIVDPEYGFGNTGVLAAVKSIEGDLKDLRETVDSIAKQIADIGGSFSESGDIKDRIDELQKYLTTEIDGNFSDDEKIRACTQLKKIISDLSAQFDNLKLVYDAMPSDGEYANYIMEEYKSAFTAENIDRLSAYTVKKGIGDKIKITAEIEQMIDAYNAQQNLYTETAYQIDALISGVAIQEPDPYLELLLEYMIKKLIADVQKKIDHAQKEIEEGKGRVYDTIEPLSTAISSQMSAYEHDFEYYFDQYLSTLNYFQLPEYLSAYELFKTYGGTSACYDPYYNYKNIAHPSFQVHPFLWNFVEATGVREIVSRSFDGLYSEKLERLQIRKYIDGVIGEFGQIVNIWQNNTTDSTGYTTRYEINSHTDEGVEYSPVIDYDGGFYPPAVKSYLQDPAVAVRSVLDGASAKSIAQNVRKALAGMTMSALYSSGDPYDTIYLSTCLCVEPYYSNSGYKAIISDFIQTYTVETSSGMEFKGSKEDLRSMVQSRLSGTFYESYYQHLHIDGDPSYRAYIAGQLSCEDIYRRISAIAEDKDSVSDVYDIYRYGMDNLKNIYVLYKKYRQPNPTYKEKRDTPGALWIRLKNHPIAFPALLSGNGTSCQVCDMSYESHLNRYLSGVCCGDVENAQGQPVDFIDIDRYCYDFSFSYDQEAIAMACVSRNAADPIFRTYDYPDLVMSIIESRQPFFGTKRRILSFSNNEGEADDIVEQPGWIPSAAKIMAGKTMTCPAYLGAYSPSRKDIRLVYAYKDHSRYSDDIMSVRLHPDASNRYDVTLMIAEYNENVNGIGDACIEGGIELGVSDFKVTGHEIAFTCDNLSKEKLTFAFPVQRNTAEFTTYNDVRISVDPNAEGGHIDDPLSPEMTSHDIFDEHIAIAHMHLNGSLFQDGNPALYNLNADMSYQPVYPGYGHKYVKDTLSGYENIELLGKSKDISESIAGVNPGADPYFELSDMLENGVYGRVYENYADAEKDILNSIFIIRQNPSFGENKKNPEYGPIITDSDKYYKWIIDLSADFAGRPSSDVMNMNIVVFNTQNMGKNPYFIGKLGQLVTDAESSYVPAYYNSTDSEREAAINAEDQLGKYTFAGINRQGYTNFMDNNRIGGIGSMKMRMDMAALRLDVTFEYEYREKAAYIPESRIKCVFYDDRNIKQFEYYHMLDSYGAVNAYEMLKNKSAIDYVVKGKGWKITYDSSKYDDEIKDRIRSFIFDGNGIRQYLDDIDLDQYSFLSDVYLYRDDRLAFKYNEEDMFEYTHSEYHYPFLNRKYPNTVAQYYATHMNFSVNEQSQSDNQLNLFDESNLFILNYDEGKRLVQAMGRIAIPVYETESDVTLRVFEDYLDTYTEELLSGYNSDRYAEDDPRLFQFAHFVAYSKGDQDITSAYIGSGGREVPDEFWRGKTVDEFSDDVLINLSGCQYIARSGEKRIPSQAMKYVYVVPSAENCDIQDLLNIQVNYSRDSNRRLTLFFNYANYINTPFVKYEDGRFKIDTIDRTYLMLKPGEQGELDIVVQARYYIGEQLYGYRNIKMLTFRIHNLSDDKPKFYITKTYELSPNELDMEKTKPFADLGVVSAEINMNDYSPEEQAGYISCDVKFTIDANCRIRPNSTAEITYPAYMIQPADDVRYAGYTVQNERAGVALVTLKDPDITEFTVRFRTARPGNMTMEYANRRYAVFYGRTNILDMSGQKMAIQTSPGSFIIRNDGTYLLAEEEERKPVGAGLPGGEYNGIYTHIV